MRLGRVIRCIVDDTLRRGDGSGEVTAAAAFDALADRLDPDNREAERDVELLLLEVRVGRAWRRRRDRPSPWT